MNAKDAMYVELVKESLLRHTQSGGISLEGLKAELKDVPEDVIFNTIEELKFGSMAEETEDGKLIMVSFF